MPRIVLFLAAFGALVAAGPALSQQTHPAIDIETLHQQLARNPVDVLATVERLRPEVATTPASNDRTLTLGTLDWLRAEALVRANRPREALNAANDAIGAITPISPNSKLRADLLVARGSAASALQNIQAALADYQAAYRIYGRAGEPRGQAIALLDIGTIYRDAGDNPSALRYNKEAINIYGREPQLLLTAYNNSGNALAEMGRFTDAEAAYRQALRAAETIGSPLLIVRVLQNIARAQVGAKDLDAAQATLDRAFLIARSGPAASWQPALNGLAALIALRRDDLDRAKTLIDRAFDGVAGASATVPLIDLHRTAYDIFRARGESGKAMMHLEAYKQIEENVRQVAASTNAALMSARFDFANQNTKIAQRDRALAESQARFRTMLLIGLLAAATIVSTLLLIGFFSIRRSRNQVRAANQTLSATNSKLEKALAAKTEFLATTSHEIRTPLNGILGMTQVILADRALPAPVRERVSLVQGAGETMKALVDDILDVAKMETGEIVIHRAPVQLTRLLDDAAKVWTDQASAKQLVLEIDLTDTPGMILADEVRLRQIVFNLMANAIKFTDQGHIRLTAVAAAGPGDGGERLAIRIEDSGIGIPADQLDIIFESFRQVDGGTTRRHGGTGLGLAICRNLARAMGGDVTVTSMFGAGSVFALDLPLERVTAPVAAERRDIVRLADADLLLVEANPLSQGIMRAVLGSAVGGLHIVADGDAALATLANGGIDHVLADGTALGLDSDAAGRLAEAAERTSARFTLLWPSPDEATRHALATAGVTHLVAKPIGLSDLLAALQKVYSGDMAGRDIAA